MSNVIALVGHMAPEQRAAVRTRVALVVEKLTTVREDNIAALDPHDGDAEREPTKGSVAPGHVDEAEAAGVGQNYLDDEPSLGWTSTNNQASRNRLGGTSDVEEEHDGREPELGVCERHPTGGWQFDGDGSQENWATRGSRYADGREEDHEIEQPAYNGG